MIFVDKSLVGEVKYYTRNWNEKDLSFLKEAHLAITTRVPVGTQMYCELWVPGEPAAAVSTGIANQNSNMQLEVFSVARGLPMKATLDDVGILVRRWGLGFIPYYDRQGSPLSLGKFDDVRDLALFEDSEGYVLKNYNMHEPAKYKPFKTVDLQVVGMVPGQGKFAGLIGSLTCRLHGGTKDMQISGMTDAQRRLMTLMHEEQQLCGKIIEVSYQYVNTQGGLRHANFLRFREDKNIADIVAE